MRCDDLESFTFIHYALNKRAKLNICIEVSYVVAWIYTSSELYSGTETHIANSYDQRLFSIDNNIISIPENNCICHSNLQPNGLQLITWCVSYNLYWITFVKSTDVFSKFHNHYAIYTSTMIPIMYKCSEMKPIRI